MRLFALFALLLAALPCSAQERVLPESREQVMLSYAPLVKKTAPAVVNIYTTRKVQVQMLSPLMMDPFFRQFFGNRLQGMKGEKEETSLGSGVIVNPKGYIITNNHVVKDSDGIKIVLSDKREFEADVALVDPTTDLALLKVKPGAGDLPFIALGDSDAIEVGDVVLAIGNPFGVGQTVTGGIISALARTTVGISDYQFFIQTDAAINPGNSGGALIDMQGKLIGVNTAIYSRTGGSNGIGFAIPSNLVAAILANQDGKGKVMRPWLGASFQNVTQEIADSLGLDTPHGALIQQLYPQGPAARAGLQPGDVVLKVDDKPIDDAQSMKFRIATQSLGKPATLEIMRAGKRYTLQLPIEIPPENPRRNLTPVKGNSPLQGVTVANLSPALASELSLHEFAGVVIYAVAEGSKADIIGFETGDILLSVNGAKIGSIEHLRTALAQKPRNWLITLKRGDKVVEVTLAK